MGLAVPYLIRLAIGEQNDARSRRLRTLLLLLRQHQKILHALAVALLPLGILVHVSLTALLPRFDGSVGLKHDEAGTDGAADVGARAGVDGVDELAQCFLEDVINAAQLEQSVHVRIKGNHADAVAFAQLLDDKLGGLFDILELGALHGTRDVEDKHDANRHAARIVFWSSHLCAIKIKVFHAN